MVKTAIDFEHQLAELCHRIGRAGWTLDMDKAAKLYGDLSQERADIEQQLHQLFPAWTVEEEFIPKRNKRKATLLVSHSSSIRLLSLTPNNKHIEFCLRQKYN